MNAKTSSSKITEGLNNQQLACLSTIRAEMNDRLKNYPEFFTTWNLLRFCKARDFDVKKTREMLTNYLNFRDKYDYSKIEAIDHSIFQPITDNYAKGYFGYDNEGRLIIVDKVSQIYPKKIFGVVEEEVIISCLVALYEHMMHIVFPILSKIHNRRIDKVFLICDLKDVSILKFFDSKVMSFLKLFAQMASDFHPEILGQQYIINTPFIFKGIWSVCKLWLDKGTTEKICIESGPALDKLKKYLNIDNLPVALGGKCQTPFSIYQGPWKDDYLDALNRRSFYLKDRSIEFEYFYTEEEKEEALKRIAVSQPKSDLLVNEDSSKVEIVETEIRESKEIIAVEDSYGVVEVKCEEIEVDEVDEVEQLNSQNEQKSDVEIQEIPSLDNLNQNLNQEQIDEAIKTENLTVDYSESNPSNVKEDSCNSNEDKPETAHELNQTSDLNSDQLKESKVATDENSLDFGAHSQPIQQEQIQYPAKLVESPKEDQEECVCAEESIDGKYIQETEHENQNEALDRNDQEKTILGENAHGENPTPQTFEQSLEAQITENELDNAQIPYTE